MMPFFMLPGFKKIKKYELKNASFTVAQELLPPFVICCIVLLCADVVQQDYDDKGLSAKQKASHEGFCMFYEKNQ